MSSLKHQTYRELGQEIALSAMDGIDSLDAAELIMELEDDGVATDEEVQRVFINQESPDSAEAQRLHVAGLEYLLNTNQVIETTMFGIPVVIRPVSESGPPQDLTGVREPRRPLPPHDQAEVALEVPNQP